VRITNMEYTPLAILAEVLAYEPRTPRDTEQFSDDDLSSHDVVVSKIRDRLEAILDSFERLGSETCETQGLEDKGVDLLMKFRKDGNEWRVGFQVKSNREADADVRRSGKAASTANADTDPESSLLKTLKRQAHEARLETKVNEWWVLPCFNLNKHKRRFTGINAHFNLHPDPNWPIRVVQPEQMLGLLLMSTAEVDAICTRLLCRDDEMLRSARQEYGALSGSAQAFVSQTFYDALRGDALVDDSAFFEAEAEGSVDVGQLRDELESWGYVDRPRAEEAHRIDPHAFPGLCALYFEGRVRHQLDESSAMTFALRMLDDVKPCDAPEEAEEPDAEP
jgi:hypothetical protein